MSENIEPGTREEAILSAIADGETVGIDPATREEALLCAIANGDTTPNIDPATRKEALLKVIAEQGGGSSVEVEPLSVTENGTYTAEQGKAYNPVSVDVFQFQTIAGGFGEAFATPYTRPPSVYDKVPEHITIAAPNCMTLNSFALQYTAQDLYCLGIKEVTLYLSKPCSVVQAFKRNSSVEVLNFPNGLTTDNGVTEFVAESPSIKTINGTITIGGKDITTAGESMFRAATALETVTLAANTVYFNLRFDSDHLTTASLVSIANSLDPTAGKTLKHTATAKANCDAVIGTVTDGLFAVDPQGDTTLSDFITNVKGWTLE